MSHGIAMERGRLIVSVLAVSFGLLLALPGAGAAQSGCHINKVDRASITLSEGGVSVPAQVVTTHYTCLECPPGAPSVSYCTKSEQTTSAIEKTAKPKEWVEYLKKQAAKAGFNAARETYAAGKRAGVAEGLGLPAAGIYGAAAAMDAHTALLLLDIAKDPADSHYTTVAKPAPVHPIAPLRYRNRRYSAAAKAMNELLAVGASLTSVTGALATAVNRAHGATDAGDANWILLQEQAAGKYAREDAALYARLPALRAELARTLRRVLPAVQVTASDVRRLKRLFARRGLPRSALVVLRRLGSEADVAFLKRVSRNAGNTRFTIDSADVAGSGRRQVDQATARILKSYAAIPVASPAAK